MFSFEPQALEALSSQELGAKKAPCGGCSSKVEHRTVTPSVAGSSPVNHPKNIMKSVILVIAVAVSGALGVLLRWSIDLLVQAQKWRHEWATLLVNLLGSFLVGYFLSRLELARGSHWLKPVLVTGFCGGLTTFSALSYQTYHLLAQRGWLALVLPLAHVWIGLGAVWIGWHLGRL